MTSKMKRVGAYLRVSTLEQSTDLQANEISAYLTSRGWNLVKFYEDKSSGVNTARPQLRQLLLDAKARRIDVVICWKLDRLARSLRDLISMLQELSELGVDFISLKDNIDLTTSAGRLMLHILGAFSQFEADLIRERVRAGIATKRKKTSGVWGRRKSVNETAIRQLREQGHSIRTIAKKLGIAKSSVQKALSVPVHNTPSERKA